MDEDENQSVEVAFDPIAVFFMLMTKSAPSGNRKTFCHLPTLPAE